LHLSEHVCFNAAFILLLSLRKKKKKEGGGRVKNRPNPPSHHLSKEKGEKKKRKRGGDLSSLSFVLFSGRGGKGEKKKGEGGWSGAMPTTVDQYRPRQALTQKKVGGKGDPLPFRIPIFCRGKGEGSQHLLQLQIKGGGEEEGEEGGVDKKNRGPSPIILSS